MYKGQFFYFCSYHPYLITSIYKSEEKGKNALEDWMEDDRLRISTEKIATRIVKTAVQGRDENSREEENNIGD